MPAHQLLMNPIPNYNKIQTPKEKLIRRFLLDSNRVGNVGDESLDPIDLFYLSENKYIDTGHLNQGNSLGFDSEMPFGFPIIANHNTVHVFLRRFHAMFDEIESKMLHKIEIDHLPGEIISKFCIVNTSGGQN